MNEDGARFDARFDDDGPFRDTPEPGGISLDSALRDFGPAAFDDLIPRVRVLARALDAAHARGVVHGALHPSKIIITDERTSAIKGGSTAAPYIAPEVAKGAKPGPAADQFALAAITYEWLFGKRIDGPARRPMTVKAMPDVDRAVLARAFTRALAPTPEVRFPTCGEFCDALSDAAVGALPLAMTDDDPDDLDSVGPFIRETPNEKKVADAHAPKGGVDDLEIVAEEKTLAKDSPFDSESADGFRAQDALSDPEPGDAFLAQDALSDPEPGDAFLAQDVLSDPEPGDAFLAHGGVAPVPAWNPSAASSTKGPARFGGTALIVAAIVSSIFGFAAGYMARPRALQSGPVETFATQPANNTGATGATGAKPAPVAPDARVAPAVPAPDARVAPATPAVPVAPAVPAVLTGRLLVRSNPSGATVSIDGVEKGVTPLALRDVEFGTRNLTIAHSGYATETRRVVINSAQPSRSLDVRLATRAVATKPAGGVTPRPSTPATLGRPAVTTGALLVDSRPGGAAVTINGKPSGATPLTVEDLAPGDYRITITLPGYRNFAATVRVVAGERVRAAYSLTAQEQE